ncbi:hypothetical protein FRC06_006952 [Ceratobasidium sp. 370]|nr:hypothetical protein FRC06_006952 [Ceratobasidium sp. 370]
MVRQTKGKGKATSHSNDDDDCHRNGDQAHKIDQALENVKRCKSNGKARVPRSKEEDEASEASEDEEVADNARLRAGPNAKPKKAPVPDKKSEVTIQQLCKLLQLKEEDPR